MTMDISRVAGGATLSPLSSKYLRTFVMSNSIIVALLQFSRPLNLIGLNRYETKRRKFRTPNLFKACFVRLYVTHLLSSHSHDEKQRLRISASQGYTTSYLIYFRFQIFKLSSKLVGRRIGIPRCVFIDRNYSFPYRLSACLRFGPITRTCG